MKELPRKKYITELGFEKFKKKLKIWLILHCELIEVNFTYQCLDRTFQDKEREIERLYEVIRDSAWENNIHILEEFFENFMKNKEV